jgi:hypothetical protein
MERMCVHCVRVCGGLSLSLSLSFSLSLFLSLLSLPPSLFILSLLSSSLPSTFHSPPLLSSLLKGNSYVAGVAEGLPESNGEKERERERERESVCVCERKKEIEGKGGTSEFELESL